MCHRCGREATTLIEGLCPECFLEEHPMIRVPEDLEVRVCAQCLSRHTGLRWEHPPEDAEDVESLLIEYALRALEDEMRVLQGARVDVRPLEVKGEPGGPGSRVQVAFLVEGEWEVEGERLRREYHLKVPVTFTLCHRCMKYRSGFYEAILQVRSFRGGLTESERKELEEFVTRSAESLLKRDPMAFISDVKHRDEGIDFYLGSTSAARKLARRLVDRFGGTVRESHELVGVDKDTGKRRYRTSISVRLPHLRPGDVIELEGAPYEVTGVGERCTLRRLTDGTRVRRDWEELAEARRLKPEPAIVVNTDPPQVVLERTGETLDCFDTGALDGLEIGRRVTVVVLDEGAVVLPEED
ncbi:60S ribosomal export protein NMD3 [Methanopyrus sp.]